MNSSESPRRRMPVGAELQSNGNTHFRVWAPLAKNVAVQVWRQNGDRDALPLEPQEHGYFAGAGANLPAGTLYKLELDGKSYPDPVSRFQPEGVHGPSQIVDPARFPWTDAAWRGASRSGQVIYEMHVGTFTLEGTWGAAAEQLPELARLGVTIIELMPVAEFPGRFGWGYDGVDLFAPTRLYGTPEDFRAFVDSAQAIGLGVILDVVYNHFGPDGNHLKAFSSEYLSRKHASEWGEAPNFDCGECSPVREFVTINAAYWIDEFHLDGLRLDATQQLFDDSDDHIIAALTRAARAAAKDRAIFLVGENEPQETRLVRSPKAGGYGIDALWNDDLHHSAMVALTGRKEAYYSDYLGKPQEFVSAAKWGYLYQGQFYAWQKKRRGTTALDQSPDAFVQFLENHDQVANSLRGRRVHQLTSPGRLRALTAFILLGPATPMLFQGQEFGASSPFFYFADHSGELAPLVAKGRREFLTQFPSIATEDAQRLLVRPDAVETFIRCKLDFSERAKHAPIYQLHCDLLRLRRGDPVFRRPQQRRIDGAVLGEEAFVLRFFGDAGGDRLLLVNLGRDLPFDPAPEPLLGPMENCSWETILSTENTRYDGGGNVAVEVDDRWLLPGHAAVVLAPKRLISAAHA